MFGYAAYIVVSDAAIVREVVRVSGRGHYNTGSARRKEFRSSGVLPPHVPSLSHPHRSGHVADRAVLRVAGVAAQRAREFTLGAIWWRTFRNRGSRHGVPGGHLDTRGFRWRSARRPAARGAVERVRGAFRFCFHDDRNRAPPGAGAPAMRRRHLLLSTRLGGASAPRPARDSPGSCDYHGDRDLAQFSARGTQPWRSRGRRECAHFGALLRPLRALEIPGWRLLCAG